MSVLPTHGPARRRILTPYVMIWMAVASFALAYLALLGLRPHMFAAVAHNTADVDQKLAQAKRDMERGLADLDPLRRTVGEVKMDVANLKIAAQEASVRDQVIMEKVTALESSAPKAQEGAHSANAGAGSPAAVPPTPKPDPRKASGARTSMAPEGPVAPNIVVTTQDPSPKNAKLINGAPKQKSANAIETGSIAHTTTIPAAAKPPAAAKAAPAGKVTPVGVILATGPSVDSLRLNWSIITDRHGDAVRDLHPRYVVNGKANGRTYGLVVGPVASTEEAKTLCKVMETRGLPCAVSIYRGTAL